MEYKPDKNNKCTFVKMGSAIIPKKKKNPKRTEKILKDRDKRLKEWKSWWT